ncbi:DUF6314 family protein [Paracoccus aerodenitrificans]|uniref:DUF6314 family protein n=1 Tax=Paracoccus aerodenitrificans TaxID=3017781 RepID=UPI0022F0363F|nr:DUF6314 family protein [Paracoccus aerodenitrificans]WBU64963.1 DUF6314 family protein [Paracoccus aerodenitrificans]
MDLLSRFLGRWRLRRDISTGARFEGTALISRSGQGAAYAEEGQLLLPGQVQLRATRDFIWRQEAGVIAVFFPDGRFFHSFDPDAPTPRARHHCAPDIYDVAYDFSGWPVWSSVWHVEGPRKSYVIRSVYDADALTAPRQGAKAAP